MNQVVQKHLAERAVELRRARDRIRSQIRYQDARVVDLREELQVLYEKLEYNQRQLDEVENLVGDVTL